MEAASASVVTVTAWQMLFDHAQVTARQIVLIPSAAGNVGGYADSGRLVAHVGTVPPLEEVRSAHEMLGGAPH